MKGLVIQLSPEAAESLRQGQVAAEAEAAEGEGERFQHAQQRTQQEQPNQHERLPLIASDNAFPSPVKLVGTTDTLKATSASPPSEKGDDKNDDDTVHHHKNNHNASESSFLSCSSSWPAIRIDLKRLVGYQPQSIQDAQRLQQEIRLALASDFEGRVAELLDSKIARHDEIDKSSGSSSGGTSSSVEGEGPATLPSSLDYARIEYPETLVVDDKFVDDDDENVNDCDYPNNNQGTVLPAASKTKTVSTARLWQKIVRPLSSPPQPQQSPSTTASAAHGDSLNSSSAQVQAAQLVLPLFVHRLLRHLRLCSQTLSWKCAMHTEILHLVEQEQRHQQLQTWKYGKRQAELDKLYQVRETILQQVVLHREKVKHLEAIREEEVQQRLAFQRVHQGGTGGLGGFDLDCTTTIATATSLFSSSFSQDMTSLFLSDDDGCGYRNKLLQEEGDLDENDDDYHDYSSGDYSQDEEEYSDDLQDDHEDSDRDHKDDDWTRQDTHSGESQGAHGNDIERQEEKEVQDQQVTTVENSTTAIATTHQHDDKGSAADRRRRRRLQQHRERLMQKQSQQQREEEEAKAKYRAARQAEEDMRQACTSLELKTAQAVVVSLQQRLNQIDDLLESLQEEEWQQQEEDEDDNGSDNKDEGGGKTEQQRASSTISDRQISVLDGILAMILGATPPPLVLPGDSNTCMSSPSSPQAAITTTTTTATGIPDSNYDHVAWLRNEHRTIVTEWKEHFGRLPPPWQRTTTTTSTTTTGRQQQQQQQHLDHPHKSQAAVSIPHEQRVVVQNNSGDVNWQPQEEKQQEEQLQQQQQHRRLLKESFGIEDRDHVDHWDDDEDDDSNNDNNNKAILPKVSRPPVGSPPGVDSSTGTGSGTTTMHQSKAPQRAGLRPGGRTVR